MLGQTIPVMVLACTLNPNIKNIFFVKIEEKQKIAKLWPARLIKIAFKTNKQTKNHQWSKIVLTAVKYSIIFVLLKLLMEMMSLPVFKIPQGEEDTSKIV